MIRCAAAILMAAVLWTASAARAEDLTGQWRTDGGETCLIRQVGNRVYWYTDDSPRVQNVFAGTLQGKLLTGEWADLPGNKILNSGTITLTVENSNRMVKTAESRSYGTRVWTRKASPSGSDCPGGTTFRHFPGGAIKGQNKKILRDTPLPDCKQACIEAEKRYGFCCRSIDYKDGDCCLQPVNSTTHKIIKSRAKNAGYYERE